MKKFLLLTFFIALLTISNAQTVTTVAGGNGNFGGNGQYDADRLYLPTGVYLDNGGYLYVADEGNKRIQKFPPGSTSTTNAVTVAGCNGNGCNTLNQIDPLGVYVDGSGNIFVTEGGANGRILEFPPNSDSSANGTIIISGLNWAGQPYFDQSGNVYVPQQFSNDVIKFQIDSPVATTIIAGGNGAGSAANQLNNPSAVFVDALGYIYVADLVNDRVQKFSPGSSSSTNGVTVAGAHSIGCMCGGDQLNSPLALFVDSSGYLYVSDNTNNRIQKFPPGSDSSTNGVTVAGTNGLSGSAATELNGPQGIYVDHTGNIYIADYSNGRVQKWGQSASGIAGTIADEAITLYPNPSNGSFILLSANSVGEEFIICDMIGRVISQSVITADKQTIDLKNISSGTYALEIKGINAIQKFTIEK